MNPTRIFSSYLFLRSIFAVSLFILIFISSITYKHTINNSTSVEILVRTNKTQIELEQLISSIRDAESGQRAFMITRDSIFLLPYINIYQKTIKSFGRLKELTKGNEEAEKNLDSLQYLTALRLAYFKQSLRRSSAVPFNQESMKESMLEGKDIMNLINIKVGNMIKLETTELNNEKAKYRNEISFTPFFTLILIIFSLLIFVLSYYKINQDIGILQQSNVELRLTTESIRHAEIIGEFCFTQWDLNTNKLYYSDNLYRLLGCEPQSFLPTIENFLKFVHPDDKDIISEGANRTVLKHETYARMYRIIRKDGEIRHFKSMGKLISDENKNLIHIGIIKDVTNVHLNKIALEQRNHELEQSNQELASFNQAASHDLQEPLRKIQTFISRISEQEMASLTENGKAYFEKIRTSATRMRILIDDLLLYSRSTKSGKEFVPVDLNSVLEDAINELSQTIEHQKASIEFVHLPTISGIPFQLQQLFVNLIGNSLKYHNPEIAPHINIACEFNPTSESFQELFNNTSRHYCKISISDNGLGFEQQYAQSIFNLFSRLHHKGEYPGTGIGLSICKKIVENHDGYINASGVVGTGATFNIYLPV